MFANHRSSINVCFYPSVILLYNLCYNYLVGASFSPSGLGIPEGMICRSPRNTAGRVPGDFPYTPVSLPTAKRHARDGPKEDKGIMTTTRASLLNVH